MNMLKAQKNEVAVQTSISNIGIFYENFIGKNFSMGLQAGTGLFAITKDEIAVMTSDQYSSKTRTEFYAAPFARYYFKDDFSAWFLMAELYASRAKSTIFVNEVTSDKISKKYFGTLVGGGYKFKPKNRLALNIFMAIGYDFNDNDLVPVLGYALVSLGYQF